MWGYRYVTLRGLSYYSICPLPHPSKNSIGHDMGVKNDEVWGGELELKEGDG
jgi:hypothetical protein